MTLDLWYSWLFSWIFYEQTWFLIHSICRPGVETRVWYFVGKSTANRIAPLAFVMFLGLFLSMNMCVYKYQWLCVLVYLTTCLGKLVVPDIGIILCNRSRLWIQQICGSDFPYSCQWWSTVCISQGQLLL